MSEHEERDLSPIDAQRIADYEAEFKQHAAAKEARDARRATYTPEARAKAAADAWARQQAAIRARCAVRPAAERQVIEAADVGELRTSGR